MAFDSVVLGPIAAGRRPAWRPAVAVAHPARGLLQVLAVLGLVDVLADVLGRTTLPPVLSILVVVCLLAHIALFFVSIAYHCVHWTPVRKRRMQRLDHSMIYVKIAGSVGPFAWLAFPPEHAAVLIGTSWSVAALGVAQKLMRPEWPVRWSSYVQVGQAMLLVPCFARLIAEDVAGAGPALGVAAAGYTLGAIVFLLERPRLWPGRFSFHELFHALLVVGGLSLGRALLALLARST